MQKVVTMALISCLSISTKAWAETRSLFLRLSYQSAYAESSMKEPVTEYSIPITFGYQFENLNFGIDFFSVQRPKDGNDTLFIESKTDFISFFFESMILSHQSFNLLAGIAAGADQTDTKTTLISGSIQSSSQNKSQWLSYTNLQLSVSYNINELLSVRVTGFLQNSVLLNPNWQPGLRSSLQVNF
jgi:hypothetical protein